MYWVATLHSARCRGNINSLNVPNISAFTLTQAKQACWEVMRVVPQERGQNGQVSDTPVTFLLLRIPGLKWVLAPGIVWTPESN